MPARPIFVLNTDVPAQDAVDAGVFECPVCHMWFAVGGKQSPLVHHISSCKDPDHRACCEDEEGGRKGWLRRLHQAESRGSAAHFRSTVCYKGNERPKELSAKLRRWYDEDARAAALRQQRAEAAARVDALNGHDHHSALNPRLIGLAPRDISLEVLGGDTLYDMAWLDDYDSVLIGKIDAIAVREPDDRCRKEYYAMLHHGLSYANRNSISAVCVRGFKFNILAKHVTTGRLRGTTKRDADEVLGRIRLVARGHLQPLVKELQAEAEAIHAEVQQAKLRAEAVARAEKAAGRPAPARAPEERELDATAESERLLRSVLRLVNAGYLSKGYAQFGASPLADSSKRKVRKQLKGLHPRAADAPPEARLEAEDMRDEPGVDRYVTTEESFKEIFKSVPKARAMGVDLCAYEELGGMYWASSLYRATLFGLVSRINDGTLHEAAADLMGDLRLVGLEKPDGGLRPIGIPAALRRLAGRCLMHDQSKAMADVFTRTAVPPEMHVAAGFDHDEPCNVPLQLGVGLAGGAEIGIATLRLHLEMNPTHAVCSDDKRNGFNAISRKATFAGLRRWFPRLVPTARLWYSRRRRLFVNSQLAVDEDGNLFFSEEGCAQGDPLGPFLWSVGYHQVLLETQARNPTALIVAYLDDTYQADVPKKALECMLTGTEQSEAVCNVSSNLAKQEVWSPEGDLSCMPPTLRGAPTAPPHEASGYAGGRLPGFKCLGAFIGEAEWCRAKLVQRVEKHLAKLPRVSELRDTRKLNTSLQCQLSIARFCANTQLTYFLRTMPPSVTDAAAERHDELIARAFHATIVTSASTEQERRHAEQQARLPVRMGGMGLTQMHPIRPAAWVGTWALVWRTMQQLHAPFADVDITTFGDDDGPRRGVFGELRQARAKLMGMHANVQDTYDRFDTELYDYDKHGTAHTRFHPEGLPPAHTLLGLDAFGSDSELLQHAQRKYSQIIHHASWLRMLTTLEHAGLREAVRFVAVSQPFAGAFLNAVPMRKPFRIPTWALRIAVQRRLGLALSAATGTDALDAGGRPHDALGDAAQNIGEAGHAERHAALLHALARIARSVWGPCVHVEPRDHVHYSADHRPDLAAHGRGHCGSLLLGELKLVDPLSSNAAAIGQRGRAVGFGNTLPPLQERVYRTASRSAASLTMAASIRRRAAATWRRARPITPTRSRSASTSASSPSRRSAASRPALCASSRTSRGRCGTS